GPSVRYPSDFRGYRWLSPERAECFFRESGGSSAQYAVCPIPPVVSPLEPRASLLSRSMRAARPPTQSPPAGFQGAPAFVKYRARARPYVLWTDGSRSGTSCI